MCSDEIESGDVFRDNRENHQRYSFLCSFSTVIQTPPKFTNVLIQAPLNTEGLTKNPHHS
jgi:hypothetical protein